MGKDFAQKLQTIEGIVWDLDNTLYRLEDAVKHAFHHAIAHAAIDAGVELSLEEAVRLANQSFADHGYSGRVFVKDFGIDDVWLHHRFHDHLDETIIGKNAELDELFYKTGLRHGLITHGSGKWARKVLTRLGLREWFPEDCILALEDYGFEKKPKALPRFS